MTALEPVLAVFSGLLALAVARTLPDHVNFYAWFRTSGLKMAEHRGYGQSACKFYGIIPAPKLSVPAMALSAIFFLALTVVPATPLCPAEWRAPALGASLIFYHLYFSQLYCEAAVGAHPIVLLPPALILLALSPALDASGSAPAAAFTCWMMKIVVTSAYCGAGVCKIWKSVASVCKGGSSWLTGSTLQAFIFEAMYLSTPSTHTTFGMPTPFSYALQKLHLMYPTLLLAPASVVAVAFETLAPLLLLAPAHLASVPFAVSGLAFHYGIALLQNIDFLSWWSPAYAFLLADPAAWSGGKLFSPPADPGLGLFASAATAYAEAPLRTSLCLAYVAIHLTAVVVLRFFPSVEILPLSAFPMFGTPQNVFDKSVRKHFWLTEKLHAAGTLKNYAFPFCRAQTVMPDEIATLPFKYVLMSHGAGKERELHANVEMTPRIDAALKKLEELGGQGRYTFATDSTAAPALLAALDEAKAAFAVAQRESKTGASADSTATTARLRGGGADAPANSSARVYVVRTAVSAAIGLFNVIDALLVGFDTIGHAMSGAVKYLTTSSATEPAPKVVILGGSFAGLRCQRALSKAFDVTVIDRKEYFEYTPGVLRLFAQPTHLPNLSTPLPTKRSKVCVGEATAVSTTAVTVKDGGGEERQLPYDYLVLACGTDYPCGPIRPSTSEVSVVQRQATWDAAADRLRAAQSVIVVGGGLVGVELVAEVIAAYPNKQATLVTNGPALCSALPPRVGVACREWLKKHGVTLRLNSPVESVVADGTSGSVKLTSGEELTAAVVYDCRGNGTPNAAALLSEAGAKDALDDKGRLSVDENLLCSGIGGGKIFGAGDAMVLAGCNDLKLGHTAELNGDVVAENIELLHSRQGGTDNPPPLLTYPYGAVGAFTAPRVFAVSLGEGYGVLSFNGIVLEGLLPAVVKALLEWTKVASCAERPVGILFWKFGDAMANWISRTLLPPPPPVDSQVRPLVLFDGVCLLCAGFVHFVLDHNTDESITFAPLQSEVGRATLKQAGLPLDVSTVVLIDEAGVHVRSTAALRVLMRCGFPYALLYYVFILLPRPLRDFGYKCVAAVRYRVFGKDDGSQCRRMTKAMRARFLATNKDV